MYLWMQKIVNLWSIIKMHLDNCEEITATTFAFIKDVDEVIKVQGVEALQRKYKPNASQRRYNIEAFENAIDSESDTLVKIYNNILVKTNLPKGKIYEGKNRTLHVYRGACFGCHAESWHGAGGGAHPRRHRRRPAQLRRPALSQPVHRRRELPRPLRVHSR